jgi:hypothetical protein
VRLFYVGVIPVRAGGETTGPPIRALIFVLTSFMFLTGAAGSAGLSAAMNAVAKSFPDRSRAAATGSVLAGFGLSAFLFSTLGQTLYHGDAGGLLLLLSVGTALPSLVGSTIIRAYPVDSVHVHSLSLDLTDEECALAREVALGTSPESPLHHEPDGERQHEMHGSGVLPGPEAEADPLIRRPRSRHSRADSTGSIPPTLLHYTPWEVFRMTDFHLLFTVLAILCGVGLEWINNVGVSA